MGQSTDGLLFYGLHIGDEGETGNEELDELIQEEGWDVWEKIYLEKTINLKEPEGEYESNKEAYSKYWDDCREALKQVDLEITAHCHCDAPMYFVHIKSVYKEASRGYPKKIDPSKMTVNPEWVQQLKAFCKVLNIPFDKKEVGWWLASMWC